MIEAWWRTLKHQWLFLHELASQGQIEQLVRFYVEQHNTVIPTPRSAARRPTRCTSEPARACSRSWS
ncbi:MAG: hypothetical protein IPN34_21045 [Planctomycetes bacterium]|nr:hypothetical protein [Planctomycetota bacterium]